MNTTHNPESTHRLGSLTKLGTGAFLAGGWAGRHRAGRGHSQREHCANHLLPECGSVGDHLHCGACALARRNSEDNPGFAVGTRHQDHQCRSDAGGADNHTMVRRGSGAEVVDTRTRTPAIRTRARRLSDAVGAASCVSRAIPTSWGDDGDTDGRDQQYLNRGGPNMCARSRTDGGG